MSTDKANESISVLIISRTSWRSDNSFGNSFTNIFSDISYIKLANIYCQSGFPDSDICSRYYQITEEMLVRNLLDAKSKPGMEVSCEIASSVNIKGSGKTTNKIMDFAKKNRWQVLFWGRELIWKVGKWKSPELNRFIDDFSPDLIFLPLYYQHYMNDIGLYVKRHTRKKMVAYVSDDVYTWKQSSMSPLYWIDRFFKRRTIKSVIDNTELLYVISSRQQAEYQNIFRLPCKVLYKCGDYIGEPPVKNRVGVPIKLVYTGNLGGGRWKTLARIGEALDSINNSGTKAQLDIYTLTPLTSTMRNKLDDGKNIFLKGSLAADQVKAIQGAADILVHVESFERKHLLEARLSFSTKIVDYLHQARCIFAVGSRECASIEYIETNDAGIVVSDEKEIYRTLRELVDAPTVVRDYGFKAYACGAKNHQSEKIKGMLKSDLLAVIAGRPVDTDGNQSQTSCQQGT